MGVIMNIAGTNTRNGMVENTRPPITASHRGEHFLERV